MWSIYILKDSVNNKNKENNIFGYLFFIPLLIFSFLLLSWSLMLKPFILLSVLISYLLGFIFTNSFLPKIFSYIMFFLLIIFIFIFDYSLISFTKELTITEFTIIIISSFIFLFPSYYFSSKNGLWKLYTIWTIWWVLILLPIIKTTWNLFILSIIWIIIFAISNLLIPFLNKNLIKKKSNFYNLIIWNLISVLFLAFEIYNFGSVYFLWNTESWISGYLTLGFLYLWFAVIYFIESFLIIQKIWFDKVKKDVLWWKNIFYTYVWISISLFSFAIAFIFSKYPEIITITWLFESTILYYFYNKTKELKIFIAWTLLFFIGLFKFTVLINVVNQKDFSFLISFVIIFISFILNLKFIDFRNLIKEKGNYIISHYILHIIAMWIMWILLLIIIPSTWNGWSMFWISIFLLTISYFYTIFNSSFLKYILLFAIWIFWFIHIFSINYIFNNLEIRNKEFLKIIQYITTLIIIFIAFIQNKFNNIKKQRIIINIVVWIYLFIISNIYIYDIFKDLLQIFSITFYWGIIASILLIYWIQKNIIKYRTLWLYFLTLTSLKVFLYDIWQIGDTNSRVFTFWILGIIFIVVSTLYSKKYWNNLIWEFRLDNIFWLKESKNIKKKKS